MKLICNRYERPDIQCTIEENGNRCMRGVRNVKRGLCTKHLARLQRNGSTKRGLSLTERQKNLAAKEKKMVEDGHSTVCLCGHAFLEHYAKGPCKKRGCLCRKFESINSDMFYSIVGRLARMGFSEPINNTIFCNACLERIVVGYWHELATIGRIKEHLRLYHLRKSFPASFSATG